MSSSRRLASKPKGGLPGRRRMRHDAHYVDALATPTEQAVGRSIPTARIEPNPFQPRVRMGDLDELISSVKEMGVLEPLIVRPSDELDGRYQLISGERRLRAAQAAGLKYVPCVEIDADDEAALEIALVENIQRQDLDAFEEADGLAGLKDQFGHTNAKLAKKIAKSKTAVSEALAIAKIPEPVRELCYSHDVLSTNALLQVARAGDRMKMEATVLRIAHEGASRDELVKERRTEAQAPVGRPKHFRFKWQPERKNFAIQIQFKKTKVPKKDLVKAVKQLLEELEAED